MIKTLIVTCLFTLSCALQATTQDVTVYVDDSYPPYSFYKNGRVQGLYIDILSAAFKMMPEYNVTMEPVPWNRGKKLMETGEGLALVPPYFHGHDWPYLYPYSIPLYQETIVVICNDAAQIQGNASWPQDFNGLIIGSIIGYDGWGGPEFRAMVKSKEFNYIEVSGSDLLIKMVAKGRTDCILMEDVTFDVEYQRILREGILQQPKHHTLKKYAVASVDPVYVGYSQTAINANRYPFQPDFQKQLDIALYKLFKSGEIAKIAASYRRNAYADKQNKQR